MHRRKLGRINHHSSIVTLGAAGLGRADLPQAVVDQAVEASPRRRRQPPRHRPHLRQRHGAHGPLDAPPAGRRLVHRRQNPRPHSRRRLGKHPLLPATPRRRRPSTSSSSTPSSTFDDLDQVTQPGGGLEALVEMRQQGLTRYIGITGHGPLAPAVQLGGPQPLRLRHRHVPPRRRHLPQPRLPPRRPGPAGCLSATQRRRPDHQNARPRRLGRRPPGTQLLVRPASRAAPDRPGPLVGPFPTRPHRPVNG